MTQWFYRSQGRAVGPLSPQELLQKAKLGEVRRDTLVRKGLAGEWVAAWRVAGLFTSPPIVSAETAAASRPARPQPPPLPPPISYAAVVTTLPVVATQSPQMQTAVIAPPPAESPAEESTALPTVDFPPSRKTVSRFRRSLGVAVLLAVVCVGYPWFHNRELRAKLQSCETYGVINADAYYRHFYSSDTVVFDLLGAGSPSARRIDPVHLVLQFAGKLDLQSIDTVILARNGEGVFIIESADLRELATSYANGGRPWSFNHFPERVYSMTGQPAFGTWSGGLLGVLGKQLEDLEFFIKRWTDY